MGSQGRPPSQGEEVASNGVILMSVQVKWLRHAKFSQIVDNDFMDGEDKQSLSESGNQGASRQQASRFLRSRIAKLKLWLIINRISPFALVPMVIITFSNEGPHGTYWLYTLGAALIYFLAMGGLGLKNSFIPQAELAEYKQLARRNLLERGLLLKAMEAESYADLHAPGTAFNPTRPPGIIKPNLHNLRTRLNTLMEQYPRACQSHGWSWRRGQKDNADTAAGLQVDNMQLKSFADLQTVFQLSKSLVVNLRDQEKLALAQTLLKFFEESGNE